MLALLAILVTSGQTPVKDSVPFPIGVWLQDPSRAVEYKKAGFNLYVGLWKGPTEEQLSELKRAGMSVICDQNAVALKHRRDPVIVGWMHQDEPDNAQPIVGPDGKSGWGPCVPPASVIETYRSLKVKDPSRPILLNLGQGAANDQWNGRGNGAKLDDYATYVQGGDILSFDVYPVAGLHDPAKIGLVAKGIDRLARWARNAKPIWNCLECTNIDGKGKASPEQVRAEAWSAIVHGSRGLIYFVHQFQPQFKEAALLADPEMLSAVKALNAQIQEMSPFLRWPSVSWAKVASDEGRIDTLAVRKGSMLYLFAVSLENHPVRGRIQIERTLKSLQSLPNARSLDGSRSDLFQPYALHIYRATIAAS